MNKVVRGLLWAAGLFIGCVVLLFVLLGGSMIHSGWSNEKQATAFCAGIAAGTPAAELEARTLAADGQYYANDSGVNIARFSGWGRSDCEMTVVDGRVIAARVVTEAYD